MNDRNKTAITHRVTAIAAAYLDGMGFKPVETEVPVEAGWVADVASFTYPTRTEARKLNIDKQMKEWFAIDDIDESMWMWGHGPLTAIVEVKVTKSDFAKDLERKFRRRALPAHFCFVAYPRGVLEGEDLPLGWYGLETSAKGTKLLKVDKRGSLIQAQCPGQVANVIAQVAIRRDHRTRHKAMRAFQKAFRHKDSQEQRTLKVGRIVVELASWLQGESFYKDSPLKDALEKLARVKVPAYARHGMAFLESLRASLAAAAAAATERTPNE